MRRNGARRSTLLSSMLCILSLIPMLAGCRLTRQADPGQRPTVHTMTTETVAQPTGGTIEKNLSGAGAREYADALITALDRTQEQARKEAFADIYMPNSTLAMAGIYLSMIEARLPEAIALAELQRAAQLVSARRPREAARVLDDLALLQPDNDAVVAEDDIQNAIRATLSDTSQNALPRLFDMTADLSSQPRLIEIAALRADLQDASSAAARRNRPLLDAALNDAAARAARLREMVARRSR